MNNGEQKTPLTEKLPNAPTGYRREITLLDEGEVILWIPGHAKLSLQSANDFRAWIGLIIGKLDRRARDGLKQQADNKETTVLDVEESAAASSE